MKIPIEDARASFAVCSHVDSNPISESSQFVRLKVNGAELTMNLTGTLWAESKATAAEPGTKWTVFADRRVFKAFLDTATGTDLELFYKDKLILKSGQRLEIAPHAVISGYETWTPKTTFELTDDQKTALKTAVRYLPNIAGSEHVEAVCFEKGYGIIATDTLCMFAVLGTDLKTDFFLPAAVANVLAGNEGKIAVDKNGVGAVIGSGVVYQPLSADLDRYPKDACKGRIDEAKKSPALTKIKAQDLLTTLRVASNFLLEKNEGAQIEATKGGLSLTIDMASGKFQRNIATASECKLDAPLLWPLKKIVPWLEYAAAVKSDIELDLARTPSATVLRFTESKRTNLILFADL